MKCAFNQCDNCFDVKNPKKRFCSLSCKNKAAYQYRLNNYQWETDQFKSRRRNIQILEYLYLQNKLFIKFDDLELLGFNTESAIIPSFNSLNQIVYKYGNILLTELTNKCYKLTKI